MTVVGIAVMANSPEPLPSLGRHKVGGDTAGAGVACILDPSVTKTEKEASGLLWDILLPQNRISVL